MLKRPGMEETQPGDNAVLRAEAVQEQQAHFGRQQKRKPANR